MWISPQKKFLKGFQWQILHEFLFSLKSNAGPLKSIEVEKLHNQKQRAW